LAQEGADVAHHGPMHQFEIRRLVPLELFGFDVSFTNSSLWMLIAVAAVSAFLILSMRGRSLVPTRMQSTAEVVYEFMAKTLREVCGPEGMKYFPFIFTLFMFILACNMLGLVPGSFTVTSHISITLALAVTVFLMVTVIGFVRNGPGYLRMFVPEGVPLLLLPLIVVIEVISYFMRPVSLSVRLFANMLAGHILLKVFAGFVLGLGLLGGIAPLVFMIGFTGFELLTCIYLNDALNLHH
jgi:F-type H+-transporting ATPase subunit a